jgi:hypothetical protein
MWFFGRRLQFALIPLAIHTNFAAPSTQRLKKDHVIRRVAGPINEISPISADLCVDIDKVLPYAITLNLEVG